MEAEKKEWKTPKMEDLCISKTNYDPAGGAKMDGWWTDATTGEETPFYS